MSRRRRTGDYAVGYGKPPKAAQFQKGRSGNPKGRPKGSQNFKTDVLKTLRTPVVVTEKGRRKTISSQRAALMRLCEKALKGDARGIEKFLSLAQSFNGEEAAANVAEALSAADQSILERYAENVRKKAFSEETERQPEESNGE